MHAVFATITVIAWALVPGLVHAQTADTAAAMTLIDNMENLYPDDYFYPYCLKRKGDIRQHQGDNEAASQIYRLILEEYNRYPFTGEVRTRLQEIEAAIPTS